MNMDYEVMRELSVSKKFWRVLYHDGSIKTIRVKKGDYLKSYIRIPHTSTYKRMTLI